MIGQEKDDELGQRAACIVAHMKSVFRETPVLKTEDPQAFDRILLDLVRSRWPRDFIQQMLVWDIAKSVWLDMRYTRHVRYVLNQPCRENSQTKDPFLLEHQTSTSPDPAEFGTSDQFTPAQKHWPSSACSIDLTTESGVAAASGEASDERLQKDIVYLREVDDLKSINFYQRNVSLQILRDYRPTGIPPASYVVRKKHEQIAEEIIAERNAAQDSFLMQATAQQSRPVPPSSAENCAGDPEEFWGFLPDDRDAAA